MGSSHHVAVPSKMRGCWRGRHRSYHALSVQTSMLGSTAMLPSFHRGPERVSSGSLGFNQVPEETIGAALPRPWYWGSCPDSPGHATSTSDDRVAHTSALFHWDWERVATMEGGTPSMSLWFHFEGLRVRSSPEGGSCTPGKGVNIVGDGRTLPTPGSSTTSEHPLEDFCSGQDAL